MWVGKLIAWHTTGNPVTTTPFARETATAELAERRGRRVWPALVDLGPDPTAFASVFERFGSCVKDAARDRKLWERSVLNDQWVWLALEEERLTGVASEMPERDFVREGVEWSRVRLDAECRVGTCFVSRGTDLRRGHRI